MMINNGANKESNPLVQGNAAPGRGSSPPRQENSIPSIFVDGFVQFLTVILLFVALLYRQTGLVILAVLILLMANGARLWSRLSLAGLACGLQYDRGKVFPGERIVLETRVENSGFLPVWMRVKIPVAKMLLPSSNSSGELTGESGLLWKQRVTWQWELRPQRRGCYQLGPVELSAGDLLGFFQRKKVVSPPGEIIVFPRLIPLKDFSFPREEFFGTQGAKSPLQDPVYPVATRDYLHGRPSRFIHWKASARHDRLQEKIFEPTTHYKSLLVIDVRQFAENGAEESFERTLEAVASLAVKADRAGSPVGIVSNGALAGGKPAVLPVSRGPEQLSAILELLGRLRMEHVGAVDDLLKPGLHLSWGTVCTCFFLQVDASLLLTKEIFRQYRISSLFITERPYGGSEVAGSRIYSLDELCWEEGASGE